MSTLYICATLLILTLGVVNFIKTTYPPRKSKFDLADVCSYVEDTLGRFEDEKIFSDCTKVITFQGDTYYLAVPFLKFDEIYEEYLGET